MTALATRPVSFISHPQGADDRDDLLTARRALQRLFDERPNEVITRADVCKKLGREVTRATICSAATSGPSALSRDLPIERVGLGPTGGYVKLQPMPTRHAERCPNCCHFEHLPEPIERTANGRPLYPCMRPSLQGRPVGLNCRCWGWEAIA